MKTRLSSPEGDPLGTCVLVRLRPPGARYPEHSPGGLRRFIAGGTTRISRWEDWGSLKQKREFGPLGRAAQPLLIVF